MSVTGLCDICQKQASKKCRSCGGLVCDGHFIDNVDQCSMCARDNQPRFLMDGTGQNFRL